MSIIISIIVSYIVIKRYLKELYPWKNWFFW
jgi:hypothetical protein